MWAGNLCVEKSWQGSGLLILQQSQLFPKRGFVQFARGFEGLCVWDGLCLPWFVVGEFSGLCFFRLSCLSGQVVSHGWYDSISPWRVSIGINSPMYKGDWLLLKSCLPMASGGHRSTHPGVPHYLHIWELQKIRGPSFRNATSAVWGFYIRIPDSVKLPHRK